jgi:hypothetical protein
MEMKIKYPVFIGMFIAMLVFSPPLAFAQQEPIPAVLPDNPFYNFKLLIENIQETLTIQEDRKAELLLKHAEERDIEARALEAQGKLIPLERLKEIQAVKIMRAEQIILRLESVNTQLVETQQEREERQRILQAQSEGERIRIIQQIEERRDRDPDFLEPTTDRPDMIEPTIIGGLIVQRAETPIEILPVEDIQETDDISVVLQKLRDRLTNSFTTSEITEIRADFQELQAEEDLERKRLLADQLDEEVNNTIVSITCFGTVDTFALSIASDPVDELQEQCPILRPIPDEELRKLANSVG